MPLFDMSPGEMAIADLRQRLRRYAVAGKLHDAPGDPQSVDPFGVQVLYNRANPHLVRFAGVTHDDIEWAADIDFRMYSRDYRDLTVQMVGDHITQKRRERQGKGPIIVLDDTASGEHLH